MIFDFPCICRPTSKHVRVRVYHFSINLSRDFHLFFRWHIPYRITAWKKIKKPLYKLRKIVYSLNIKNWIQRGGQGCHDNHGIRAHFFKRQRWRLCFEESDRKTRSPAESRVRRERDNREHSGAGWLRATLDTPPAAAGRSSRDCALSSERVKRKTIVSF